MVSWYLVVCIMSSRLVIKVWKSMSSFFFEVIYRHIKYAVMIIFATTTQFIYGLIQIDQPFDVYRCPTYINSRPECRLVKDPLNPCCKKLECIDSPTPGLPPTVGSNTPTPHPPGVSPSPGVTPSGQTPIVGSHPSPTPKGKWDENIF